MTKYRLFKDRVFKYIMMVSMITTLFFLFCIIAVISYKGLPSLNWQMITQTPKGGYYLAKEGGVLNAILGSLYLSSMAIMLTMMISIPLVLYMNNFLKKGSLLVWMIRFVLDVLCGVPSIVYGALALIIMYFFGIRASSLGGIIALSLVIFPIMARSLDEVMQLVPGELLEASYALGTLEYEISFYIMLRQTFPGIIMAILLSFSRAVGDAASVLFTAGFSDRITFSFFRPVATLPLSIFFQLTSPIPQVQNRAYASAIILTIIILIISIAVRFVAGRGEKYIIK